MEILLAIFEMEESDSRIQESFWGNLFRAIRDSSNPEAKMG